MTTRSKARIYRGRQRRLADGACPSCTRVVSITRRGCRRAHNDQDGVRCTGSGVFVGEREVILDDLPEVDLGAGRWQPGIRKNKWSGKP